MQPFSKILVPVDFSECSSAALKQALLLRAALASKVDVLHAFDLPTFLPPSLSVSIGQLDATLAEHAERHAREQLQSFLGAHGLANDAEVGHQVVLGSSAGAVLDAAGAGAYDLITMGTHGRSGAARLLLGSTADKVVRRAPCAVLTVRHTGESPNADEAVAAPSATVATAPQRILVPVDLGSSSRQALRRGLQLAALFGAQVHVLYAWEAPFLPRETSSAELQSPPVSLFDIARQQCTRALTDFVDEVKPEFGGVGLEWFVQSGDPRELISKHVQAHACDLIVMGTHGQRGAMSWLLGSVAQYVVSRASVPVLVERPAP